jgi:hypothetical protein
MLILAVISINLAAVAVWSAVYGANGFLEVGKLIRGEPSFIPPESPYDASGRGEGGPLTEVPDPNDDRPPSGGGGAW